MYDNLEANHHMHLIRRADVQLSSYVDRYCK
jgi:hypothetical protein